MHEVKKNEKKKGKKKEKDEKIGKVCDKKGELAITTR